MVLRVVEASFQSLPNLSPSTFGVTASSTGSITGLETVPALALIQNRSRNRNRNRNTGYKIRGLLASPASVNVSLYLENFQQLMMGGFKSVQLWYCQEETSSQALSSHRNNNDDDPKDLRSRGDVVLGGATTVGSSSSSSSCVFVPDRKVRINLIDHNHTLTYSTLPNITLP